MHLVRALVFLFDPLEHFISLASARDELIFDFGLLFRLFLWFVVEGSSLSWRFLQGRHGTSDSDEGHDFDCFQHVQVGRVSGELKKHGSFKLAGMFALKLKKKPATPARKGVNQLSKEMPVGWRPGQPWCKRRPWKISLRRYNRLLLLHRSRISMPSASAFVCRLRPRTLPWRKSLCSRAPRIGNLQLGLVCGCVKSSNNVVLFSSERPDAVSSAARALDAFRGAVLRGSRDHWLDMKKELNKVLLRQSVMNWVEDGAEDFVVLGS